MYFVFEPLPCELNLAKNVVRSKLPAITLITNVLYAKNLPSYFVTGATLMVRFNSILTP